MAGADPGGGGGVRTPHFGGPHNFIKGGGTLCTSLGICHILVVTQPPEILNDNAFTHVRIWQAHSYGPKK